MEPLRLAIRREVTALLRNLRDPAIGQRLSYLSELGRSVRGRLSLDVAQLVRDVELFRVQGGEGQRLDVERGALKIIGETIEL